MNLYHRESGPPKNKRGLFHCLRRNSSHRTKVSRLDSDFDSLRVKKTRVFKTETKNQLRLLSKSLWYIVYFLVAVKNFKRSY